MKFLITDSIGSYLVDCLKTKDNQLLVLDDFSGTSGENLDGQVTSSNLGLVCGSILSETLVKKLMNDVTHCFHLAVGPGVKKINNNKINSLGANLKGSEIF